MSLIETVLDSCSFTGSNGTAWPDTSEGSTWTLDSYNSPTQTRTIDTNRGKAALTAKSAVGWLIRPTDQVALAQAGGRAIQYGLPGVAGTGYSHGYMARVRNLGSGTTDAFMFAWFSSKSGFAVNINKIVDGTRTVLYTASAPAVGAMAAGDHIAWRVVDTPDTTKCFCEFKAWDPSASEPAWTTPVNSGTGTPVDSSTQLVMYAVADVSDLNGQTGLVGWGCIGADVTASFTVDEVEWLGFSESQGLTLKGTMVYTL